MKVVRAMENVVEVYWQLFDKENTRKSYQFAISKGSLSLKTKKPLVFALVGNELETPIEEDIFELELMEDVKSGPLAHLISKGLPLNPQDTH